MLLEVPIGFQNNHGFLGNPMLQTVYLKTLTARNLQADPAQLQAIELLQPLLDQLQQPVKPAYWLSRFFKPTPPIISSQGVYLWGDVGRGKTFLMDLFYDAIPEHINKTRFHYHRFMQYIHGQLHTLKHIEDPLKVIAQRFAQTQRVLCLDEFFVIDITDAMLLYRLLDALLHFGVIIVITTNCSPDMLYRNGLQRERFLPAIALIKRQLKVYQLASPHDYRLRHLIQASNWLTPPSIESEALLYQRFLTLADHPLHPIPSVLSVCNRDIVVKQLAHDIVWFEFSALCDGPRAAADYIEIATRYSTLIISHIPLFNDQLNQADNQARRFINLIDELYDRKVKLIASADAAPHQLYNGKLLKFEFERVISRLIEMQSHEYLTLAHQPITN